jgi:hypothetical protein
VHSNALPQQVPSGSHQAFLGPGAAGAGAPGSPVSTAEAAADALAAAALAPGAPSGPVKHASSDLEPVLTAAMEAVTAAITTTTSSSSGDDGAAPYNPLTALSEQLASAASDWNPRGRPDSSGSMVGGAVLMKLEPLASMGPADMAGYINPHGRPQVIAAAGQYVALGMPNSVTIIVQLPMAHGQHSGGGAAAAGGSSGGPAATSGGSATGSVHVCGEVKHGTEAVTALGFSTVASAGDGLWLAVGHLSGAVALWDLQRRGPRLITTIRECVGCAPGLAPCQWRSGRHQQHGVKRQTHCAACTARNLMVVVALQRCYHSVLCTQYPTAPWCHALTPAPV